jgi:hypothetical protein
MDDFMIYSIGFHDFEFQHYIKEKSRKSYREIPIEQSGFSHTHSHTQLITHSHTFLFEEICQDN